MNAATFATDMNLMTSAVTDTENGAGWLKLQFSKTHLIHKVVVYHRFYTHWYKPGAWCSGNIEKFKGCVDQDNNVDVSVYQGEVKQKSCGTLQLTYGLKQTDQIYTLICNTAGDSVKLTKHTAVKMRVFDIAVISTGKIRRPLWEVATILPLSYIV